MKVRLAPTKTLGQRCPYVDGVLDNVVVAGWSYLASRKKVASAVDEEKHKVKEMHHEEDNNNYCYDDNDD